ncbi:3-oxoacyl-(acyl-carrier-protein) synthase [Hymenobacter daecheongensis DSM 21074]|uniref:3-oxoacyl-(Acyl-carrier-protein) synthase n=1 Tax=Hymenobacter daecheongensis DSM 21074 TaxID=1121955 RepID=A0A1M6KGZ0_9BACT|nr:beta-ketoacyl synthase N-terminal-like domain-containing protein [Hymenobacter daecheongensis]SHJ58233.1 3-oxoacyl-(acyl-carrier-protein) synthase [Hymenobacter daecheongensis DSM 21074]
MTNPTPATDDVILLRGRGRISALGTAANGYAAGQPGFATRTLGRKQLAVAALPPALEDQLTALRKSQPAYRQLDRTVLLAIVAARQATAEAGWAGGNEQSAMSNEQVLITPNSLPNQPIINNQKPETRSQKLTTNNEQQTTSLAVSIGSSRGATGRTEHYHHEFLSTGDVAAAASPLTTLGNVASWVAFDAGSAGGAALSHSSTCSSAFQALGNAMAWLRAGMAGRFLAGGTEAPLTDFTLAQMHALGIYSPFAAADFPCRPGAGRPSTFVLGEGAAVFALEKISRAALLAEQRQRPVRPLFVLESVGFGFEAIGSKTGLSADGRHFQTAMRQALAQAGRAGAEVDAIVLHSPGTPAGDAAERQAIRAVFGEQLPDLVSNKWLLGHTLGASAALSLDFACHILASQSWPAAPFATDLTPAPTRPIRRVLVNAAGFGGNAASALVAVL